MPGFVVTFYRYPRFAAQLSSIGLAMLLLSCGGGGGSGDSAEPLEQIPQGELSIRGTIAVAPALTVDVDTNDPDAPPYDGPDNDLPYDDINTQTTLQFSGQPVANPGTAGGFVAFRGQGSAGPATSNGDLHDFYRIPLLAGQSVSLLIADHIDRDPLRNDIDLLLLNLDGFLVDAAAGVGPIETLAVQETGEYFVLVTACANDLNPNALICGAGASNYLLTIGQGDVPASGLRLSADFVPGEALVRYRPDEPAAAGRASSYATATASTADAKELGRVGDVRRMALPMNTNIVSAAASRSAAPSALSIPPELQAKLATLEAIKKMQQQAEVLTAEPNYVRQPLYEPDDPGYKFQWHYPLINLPAAWDLGIFGANVTVAVLDTGILPRHPDLDGQLDLVTGGYDFVSSTFSSLDGDGPDPDPTDPGDGSSFGFTSSFHGTHVAGTIAAAMDNQTGVVGVAPAARILPVRVLGGYGGTSFDISQGICFAAGLSTGANCDGVPANSNPADIINMSLGGSDPSLLEEELIDEVRAAGVLLVAAAGNGASSVPSYPAAYDGVIAVSAVGPDKARAPYSSFGSFVDVTAPGGNLSRDLDGDGYVDGVLSTGGNDSGSRVEYVYPFFQGTSMSAPHVAGVLALMRAANADMLPEAVDTLLAAGELTVPLGNQSGRNDSFGYGLIDAQKALTAALAAGGNPPAPRPWLGVTPSGLNFGATLEALQFTLRNNSTGALNILSIEADADWLIVPPLNGLGDYTLRVDRSSLAEGSYAATLTIRSDVNEVQIPVIVQKSNLVLKGDVGHLYVRLIDPGTGKVRQVEADNVDGKYTWRIRDLPPGQYQLVAFTDADNDDKPCDGGEACGSYLTSDQPVLIDVQAGQTGLDFPVNYGVVLSDPDDTPKPDDSPE
jgi:serine protease